MDIMIYTETDLLLTERILSVTRNTSLAQGEGSLWNLVRGESFQDDDGKNWSAEEFTLKSWWLLN